VSTGPDERAARGRMRAGHADREHVINELKAAFVQGRLDQDELGERAGRAVTARTYAELDALTADIPAPAGASTAGAGSPGRTLARAAKRAAICLLAAAALVEAAFLAGNFLLIVAAGFAAIAASGFLGYGIIDAARERNTRQRLASGSGPGGGGAAGGRPARGRLGPGERGGQTMAEARARRPRPAGTLQRGWAVS
jgi:DUF1707 SHOCT-like domain